jgi:hypothetical protein
MSLLKEGYKTAACCCPQAPDPILGYFSHNNVVVVHRRECTNVLRVEASRLVSLTWEDILADGPLKPDEDYLHLDELDFGILRHHQEMGIDYSLVVADILGIEPAQVFERHKKLRNLKLLKRVERVMIRYRKNVVPNKWIKHRNHTYYELTPKGKSYLDHFTFRKDKPG